MMECAGRKGVADVLQQGDALVGRRGIDDLREAASGQAQNAPPAVVAGIPVNYDEGARSRLHASDPLLIADGNAVPTSAKDWLKKRRPKILSLFEENQFGRSPGRRQT